MSPRRSCALLGVIDSDTLRVEWEGQPRLLRLMDVCPERARPGGARQPTAFGRKTLKYLKNVYLKDADSIEIETIRDEPLPSNSGKLLAYVFHAGENINERLVREGWSPCFDKYGYPLIYCTEMYEAEHRARYEGRGVWGGLGSVADYPTLKCYWLLRAGQVEAFRKARALGEDVFDTRLHYHDIRRRAEAGASINVFGDITRTYRMADGATIMQIGCPHQPFCAYFPRESRDLAGFIERCFVGHGKANYLYFDGELSLFQDQPQITIERLEQISACLPRSQAKNAPVEV
jgi:endonuclease YncB( thermonuclease family)